MATKEEQEPDANSPAADLREEDASAEGSAKPARRSEGLAKAGSAEAELHDGTPANLGATRYVHAAFFAAGILFAYLFGKVLAMLWNTLAEWPTAVEYVPQLVRYSEDERGSLGLAFGAVLGVLAVVHTYRKEYIRTWAGEVALELSRVVWPDKETVTNGTMVVVVASAVATLYVALLDRFWSFVTNFIYGGS